MWGLCIEGFFVSPLAVHNQHDSRVLQSALDRINLVKCKISNVRKWEEHSKTAGIRRRHKAGVEWQ
jgi:hypothetical protein